LIAGEFLGAAFGALLSKDEEDGAIFGAILGAAFLATLKADKRVKKSNVTVLVEQKGKPL